VNAIDILHALEQMGMIETHNLFNMKLISNWLHNSIKIILIIIIIIIIIMIINNKGSESVTFDELREFGFGEKGSWQQPFHAEVISGPYDILFVYV
jgi:hypothetical protein